MADSTPRGIDYPTEDDLVKSPTSASELAKDFKVMAETTDTAIGRIMLFRGNLPSGNILSYYGGDYTGLWAVPTQTAADAISNKPSGAGAGNVLILQVGSTTSTQTWAESGQSGRVWSCAVTSGARVSPWKELTSGAHYGNIAQTPITHFDSIDYDSEYSVWSGSLALSMGSPISAVGKIKTEIVGSFALQTFKTLSAVGAGPEIYTRAKGSSAWSDWFKVHPVSSGAGAGSDGVASGFKNVAFPLTQQSAGGTESISNATVRFPVQPGVGSNRARLHIQNWNYYTGIKLAGEVSFTGAWFGRAAGGNFISPPAKVLNAFTTPSDGDEYVSPWFPVDVAPGAYNLLSVGFTNASGQSNAQSIAGCYRSASSADAALSTGFTNTASSNAPFDVWLELEVPADTNVVAGFGDSNTVGTGTTLPVHDAWISKYCRTIGALPYFMAVHGATSNSWNSAEKNAWAHYASSAKPDSIVYFLGQNDLQDGVTLAELQAKVGEVLPVVRELLSENVYAATLTPANNKSAAVNTLRRSFNSWLKTKPLGFKDCFDFSAAVSDDDATIRASDNYDGLHMLTSGHTKLAAKIPSSVVPPRKYTVSEAAGRTVSVWDFLNNREQLIYGDTGARNITSLFTGLVGGSVIIRRTAQSVEVDFQAVMLPNGSSIGFVDLGAAIPAGFRPPRSKDFNIPARTSAESSTIGSARFDETGKAYIYRYTDGEFIRVSAVWMTNEPWPTSLPGSPA